jgi:hypothetical protein
LIGHRESGTGPDSLVLDHALCARYAVSPSMARPRVQHDRGCSGMSESGPASSWRAACARTCGSPWWRRSAGKRQGLPRAPCERGPRPTGPSRATARAAPGQQALPALAAACRQRSARTVEASDSTEYSAQRHEATHLHAVSTDLRGPYAG